MTHETSRFRFIVLSLIVSITTVLIVSCDSSGGPEKHKASSSSQSSPQATLTEFPNAKNTGVPGDVKLEPYKGPCVITKSGTTISGKDVYTACKDGDGRLLIRAANVKIKDSKLPQLHVDSGSSFSASVTDSEIDGGEGGVTPAAWEHSLTFLRVNVHGGSGPVVTCDYDCTIVDSYIHDPWLAPAGDSHLGGFLNLKGPGNILLRHNTISCNVPNNKDGGGCTGPLNLLNQSSKGTHNVTIDHNFIPWSTGSYCASYGGWNDSDIATNIVVTNNVFERGPSGQCGVYGVGESWPVGQAGNIFKGNKYQDGTPITVDDINK